MIRNKCDLCHDTCHRSEIIDLIEPSRGEDHNLVLGSFREDRTGWSLPEEVSSQFMDEPPVGPILLKTCHRAIISSWKEKITALFVLHIRSNYFRKFGSYSNWWTACAAVAGMNLVALFLDQMAIVFWKGYTSQQQVSLPDFTIQDVDFQIYVFK